METNKEQMRAAFKAWYLENRHSLSVYPESIAEAAWQAALAQRVVSEAVPLGYVNDAELTANQLLVRYSDAGEHPIFTDEKFQVSGAIEDDYWHWVRDSIAESMIGATPPAAPVALSDAENNQIVKKPISKEWCELMAKAEIDADVNIEAGNAQSSKPVALCESAPKHNLTALDAGEIAHHFKNDVLFYMAEQVDALLTTRSTDSERLDWLQARLDDARKRGFEWDAPYLTTDKSVRDQLNAANAAYPHPWTKDSK